MGLQLMADEGVLVTTQITDKAERKKTNDRYDVFIAKVYNFCFSDSLEGYIDFPRNSKG
jgi:hypothetical protein